MFWKFVPDLECIKTKSCSAMFGNCAKSGVLRSVSSVLGSGSSVLGSVSSVLRSVSSTQCSGISEQAGL